MPRLAPRPPRDARPPPRPFFFLRDRLGPAGDRIFLNASPSALEAARRGGMGGGARADCGETPGHAASEQHCEPLGVYNHAALPEVYNHAQNETASWNPAIPSTRNLGKNKMPSAGTMAFHQYFAPTASI